MEALTVHIQPPSAEAMERAIKLGHEPSTVSVKGVAWFLVGLVLTLAATFGLIYVVLHVIEKEQEKSDLPRSSLAEMKTIPAEPRIQPSYAIHETTDREDLATMRAREDARFAKMGWINNQGDIHVPQNLANQVIQAVQSGAGSTNTGAGNAQ